jgi:hypothetical protein
LLDSLNSLDFWLRTCIIRRREQEVRRIDRLLARQGDARPAFYFSIVDDIYRIEDVMPHPK